MCVVYLVSSDSKNEYWKSVQTQYLFFVQIMVSPPKEIIANKLMNPACIHNDENASSWNYESTVVGSIMIVKTKRGVCKNEKQNQKAHIIIIQVNKKYLLFFTLPVTVNLSEMNQQSIVKTILFTQNK